jgi:hypothetical protein
VAFAIAAGGSACTVWSVPTICSHDQARVVSAGSGSAASLRRLLTVIGNASGAPAAFPMTVRKRRKLAALPDPADTARAWSWEQIAGTLPTLQADPPAAIANATARAFAGSRFADDAALELFLDMPDSRRAGRAGPPKDPTSVRIPPVPAIEHDRDFFDALDANPIQAGILAPLRREFGL